MELEVFFGFFCGSFLVLCFDVRMVFVFFVLCGVEGRGLEVGFVVISFGFRFRFFYLLIVILGKLLNSCFTFFVCEMYLVYKAAV